MKKWYASSVCFSLVLMVACMATVPQAAYAKTVGGVIGKANASLTRCTTTLCTITLAVDVKLSPNTKYAAYIASSVCPDVTGIFYGPVRATSDGQGSFKKTQPFPNMGLLTFSSKSWQVCIFSNQSNAGNPIVEKNLVARGHLSVSPDGKKAHATVHSITIA